MYRAGELLLKVGGTYDLLSPLWLAPMKAKETSQGIF